MKFSAIISVFASQRSPLTAQGAETETLTAYFSWSGFTEAVAKVVSQKTRADLFEIVPSQPYGLEYAQCLERARKELAEGEFPELLAPVLPDIGPYQIVFLGFPNWLGHLPRPVATFLRLYDMGEKFIFPFCSTGGGPAVRAFEEVQELAPSATVIGPLSLRVASVSSLPTRVDRWLQAIGFLPQGGPNAKA